jgi:hypothetical protein
MNKSTLAFHFEQDIDINDRFKAFRSTTLSMLQAIIKHAESTYYTQPITPPYSLTNPDPDPLARGSLPPSEIGGGIDRDGSSSKPNDTPCPGDRATV